MDAVMAGVFIPVKSETENHFHYIERAASCQKPRQG
jgi:hypothetical protein